MIKIKSVGLQGFRGARKTLNIKLDSANSLLLYGDNGTGKSSITDGIEWFYSDRVEHLSKEEIGTKGIDALRNIFLEEEEDAFVELLFTDSKFNSNKKLSLKKAKLVSEFSNKDNKFNDYINASLNENLFLRYKDLLRFIVFTKSQRLEEISSIIGYSDVTKTKSVLKKAAYDLKKELKIKDYEHQINVKQSLILEQLGQNIYNDEQYFKAIQDLVAPLKPKVEVKDDQSIETLLELIKKPEDKEAILVQESYAKAIGSLTNLKPLCENSFSSYKTYHTKYQSILKDVQKVKKINLEKLLSEGLSLLIKKVFEDDRCPLCLQDKNRDDLIDELRKRIEELSVFKKEKEELEEEQRTTIKYLQAALSEIGSLEKEKILSIDEHKGTSKEVNILKTSISSALDKFKMYSLTEQSIIIEPDKILNYDESKFNKILSTLTKKQKEIAAEKKEDIKYTINSKLALVKQAYKEIKSLQKESAVLSNQIHSTELIYQEFIKKQKKGLTSFLKAISQDINDLYLYMNTSEKVEEIELIPLGEEDEFVGITIQFKFHGAVVSPPDKYLSESHLNCLGICLFLSSIKAFNKVNKFFVLDDVISSFDKNHRGRFAQLLKEKFADYQILLFTHERDWFEYVANMVKGTNWIITKTIWDYENGASIEVPLYELKDRIGKKFSQSDTSELGNLIRRCLERMLKEICFNLEVKLKFMYNDRNENRMVHELLSELKATLKDKNCAIKDNVVFERLLASVYLGNVTSHHSSFTEGIEDLKMFYKDVIEIENLFLCNKCSKLISKKYFDNVKSKIRCSCDNLSYDWKS